MPGPRTLTALAVASAFLIPAAAADGPIDVGCRAQLFVDRRFVAESEGIELGTNPAQKLGLISEEAGRPIDGHVSRVLDDHGKIRFYFGAEGLAVYESDDGLRFTRAEEIPGDVLPTIFLDPHDPEVRGLPARGRGPRRTAAPVTRPRSRRGGPRRAGPVRPGLNRGRRVLGGRPKPRRNVRLCRPAIGGPRRDGV